ncbi:elongation factor P maturation arginine rhamnosyltransferase EarP [Polaromonas sp.]|uniref:elongation factor P maturation arginine rhamnosyltransferase EarP n=1 Tax=Polaromonas sp. TaxID=1869339 RepID=UPI002FC75062
MNRRLQWDIFCKVIDNFGDIGVCWRLSADLASRGHRVRLWLDDARALGWMAPAGCPGVQVLPWAQPLALDAAGLAESPGDVLVEAFGCEIAPEFIAACAQLARERGQKPVWINLEYLSAESYVERSHAMPSPVLRGPAAGWTKWFFYPGFTPQTGGLLREENLPARQAAFNRAGWLAAHGVAWSGEKLVSLFCYEPPALAQWLGQLAQAGLEGQAVRLLVAAGRAEHAVKAHFESKKDFQPASDGRQLLSISYLPLLTQTGFDELLWACDLNFVRGEDSAVRALWAGKPFVWQIYPQDDGAQWPKLDAFLDMLSAPRPLRDFHRLWNGDGQGHLPTPDLARWGQAARAARARLQQQDDLVSCLLQFVRKNR